MKIPHGNSYCGESRCNIMMSSQERRFSCPLTNTIMEDPVSVPCCGANFERRALLKWMRQIGYYCPVSRDPLQLSDLVPNATLQWEILYLERKNSQDGSSCIVTSRTTTTTSSRPIPCPPSDMPPSMPRSPSSVDARDNNVVATKNQRGHPSRNTPPLASGSSCHSTTKGDLPPILPRSPPSRPLELPLKRMMDSAPSLPQRKDIDTLMDVKLTQIFLSQRTVSTSCNATFLSTTPHHRKNEIMSVIDDVLAVLSDDDTN